MPSAEPVRGKGWGQKPAYRRLESEATETASEATCREFGEEERQGRVRRAHWVEGGVLFAWLCSELGEGVTALSSPVTKKKKTSAIG